MTRTKIQDFSRRERQIMDIVYRLGEATAAEVMRQMPEAPGYSTVRTLLGVLERKGHLNHERRGHHYVYRPTTPVETVSSSMLEHVMETDCRVDVARLRIEDQAIVLDRVGVAPRCD